MPIKDPDARRAYHREYLRRRLAGDPDYKAAHLSRVRRNDEKSRKDVRDLIAAFKAHGCKICGETQQVCLSAHHLDPGGKEFSLGNAARQKLGRERVIAELAKCVCLCHNCHAKVHAGLIEA